eukprot:scaffold1292_cov64-Phaeocystis_antarctica.AAC.3
MMWGLLRLGRRPGRVGRLSWVAQAAVHGESRTPSLQCPRPGPAARLWLAQTPRHRVLWLARTAVVARTRLGRGRRGLGVEKARTLPLVRLCALPLCTLRALALHRLQVAARDDEDACRLEHASCEVGPVVGVGQGGEAEGRPWSHL